MNPFVEVEIKGRKVLIDACDAHLLELCSWQIIKGWKGIEYVVANKRVDGEWKTIRLHRLVAGAPAEMEVDHRNGNGLDNRRANLRVATHRENALNSAKKKDAASPSKACTTCHGSTAGG